MLIVITDTPCIHMHSYLATLCNNSYSDSQKNYIQHVYLNLFSTIDSLVLLLNLTVSLVSKHLYKEEHCTMLQT